MARNYGFFVLIMTAYVSRRIIVFAFSTVALNGNKITTLKYEREIVIAPASRLRSITRSLPKATVEHNDFDDTVKTANHEVTASRPLSPAILETLATRGYVIIPNFLPSSFVDELRNDILTLRNIPSPTHGSIFRQAKIGQDSTNELNTQIRIAETCFLGRGKKELEGISSFQIRNSLYDIIDTLRTSLDTIVDNQQSHLDSSLTELLYVYYPKGGYYRRHRDAIPNSASVLRKYSLLLYLNDAEKYNPILDAGQLRLHFDGGGDTIPEGAVPSFIDVDPVGGTLVLFRSDLIPHEVLDTNSERFAIVGWFNRGVSVTDIGRLVSASGGGTIDVVRMGLLLASMAMVTYGVATIVSSGSLL